MDKIYYTSNKLDFKRITPYLNELSKVSESLFMLMFADDTNKCLHSNAIKIRRNFDTEII